MKNNHKENKLEIIKSKIMSLSTLALVLKTPCLLIILMGAFGGFYAAYYNMANITYASGIILTIIFLLYVLGAFIQHKIKTKDK